MSATDTPLAGLPALRDGEYIDEKKLASDDDIVEKKSFAKESSVEDLSDRDDVLLVNGEPVIRTGEDVSNYLLDIRDDGDEAFTFRSIVLGTLFAALGAAMCQVRRSRAHMAANVER